MFHPFRWLLISTLALLVLLWGQPHPACAQSLTDPATLHVGPGTTTSPVQIAGSTVTVSQTSNGATPLDSNYELILAVPNTTSTSATITSINGSPTTVTGTFQDTLVSGPSGTNNVYAVLGLEANASVSFTNLAAADLAILGITANSFGLFTYTLPSGTNLGTTSGQATDTFTFSGLSPGTFVVAYGVDTSSGQAFSVPFTHTGLSVPEPGSLLGASVVTLVGLGYTWRRRKRATA